MSEMEDFDLTSMSATEPAFGMQLGHVIMKVHVRSKCEGRDIPCCIHSPSNHHMRTWPMNWRADTGVMERTCPHGVGHPDPDHLAYVTSVGPGLAWQGSHGCDGCCRSAEEDRVQP